MIDLLSECTLALHHVHSSGVELGGLADQVCESPSLAPTPGLTVQFGMTTNESVDSFEIQRDT